MPSPESSPPCACVSHNSLHPHALTPSHLHALTPAHPRPHARMPSHPHTLTLSRPHARTTTPSRPHVFFCPRPVPHACVLHAAGTARFSPTTTLVAASVSQPLLLLLLLPLLLLLLLLPLLLAAGRCVSHTSARWAVCLGAACPHCVYGVWSLWGLGFISSLVFGVLLMLRASGGSVSEGWVRGEGVCVGGGI